MRKFFAALLLTSLALPSAHGQGNSAPPPRPLPTPKPAIEKAVPAKSTDSRNIFQKIFGARPTPTPAPTATPAPVKRTPRPRPKPAPDTTEEPVKKIAPKVAPAPKTTPVEPPVVVKPRTGKGSKKGAPANAAANPEDDATKFKAAKAKAMEDAHVRDLKGKADSEVNDAEAQKALTNYNRALFQKIREVDPSVSDYAGKVEQSMNKRIGNEKKE